MEFSEITLNSKYLFDKYLKKHDPQISELTFTNFFRLEVLLQIQICSHSRPLMCHSGSRQRRAICDDASGRSI